MKLLRLKEGEVYIKLGQAMKKAGMEASGVDAKYDILEGRVKVNGETEMRRGRKLYAGDVMEYRETEVRIENAL